MTEKSERKADRMYILTERQFIESVLVGATQKRYLPPGIAADAQRCQVETAENGGVVVRVWLGPIVAGVLEPQVLQPLLVQYASELPGAVPTLAQVKAWKESDLEDVSRWVRVLHARANPIAGMVVPEQPDQPLILFEVKPEPMPERRVAKKKAAKKKAAKVHFQSKKERKQREAARAGAEAARNLIEESDAIEHAGGFPPGGGD